MSLRELRRTNDTNNNDIIAIYLSVTYTGEFIHDMRLYHGRFLYFFILSIVILYSLFFPP